MEYITYTEFKNLLINDFEGTSNSKIDRAIANAGTKINSYISTDLRYEENVKQKVRPFSINGSTVLFRLKKTNICMINFAELIYSNGEREFINVDLINFEPDSDLIEIKNVSYSTDVFPVKLDIDYDGGYDTDELDPDVKLACAYIARQLLKNANDAGDTGLEASGSTSGARVARAKNREYEEQYSYGAQSKESFPYQIMGALSEMEEAYALIEKYRKIY